MIRTIIWVALAVIFLILTLPFNLYAKLSGKGYWWTEHLLSLFGPIFTGIMHMDVEAEGLENIPEGGALFVGNHQSQMDVVIGLFHMGRPKAFVAKEEISKIPVASWWLDNLGCVYIKRGNVKEAVKTMQDVQQKLENGAQIIIFPEGTRSKGPEMNEFKPGALRSAIKAGVPVVPFALDGTYHCLEEKGHLAPGKAKVHILKPIDTAGRKTQELSDMIFEQIQNELTNMRQ